MHFANPFAVPGRWFKGSLHIHSSASDGDLTPDEIIGWYRKRGYHFLALTDHGVWSKAQSLGDDFITLSGIEVKQFDPLSGEYHLVGLGLSVVRHPSTEQSSEQPEYRNPLSMTTALGFAAVYAGVLVLAAWAQESFENAGIYTVTAIAATVGGDAPTLSLARLAVGGQIDVDSAARGIGVVAVMTTLGKACALLTDNGIVSIWHRSYELICKCPFCRFDYLIFGCVVLAVSNVGCNSIVKGNDVLRHHPDLTSEALECAISNVGSVNQNRACVNVIETREQIYKRSFARTVGSYYGDGLSCFYGKVYAVENRSI